MMRILFGALLLLAAGAAPAAAKSWEMKPGQSRLSFTATVQGAAIQGEFQSFEAEIQFDPSAPEAARIVIKIPLGNATMGAPDLDQQVKSPTWFHVAGHPAAVFTTTGLTPLGGGVYDVAATLTLRGVTMPVSFPATILVTGDMATAEGEVVLNRSDYGVGQGDFEKPDLVAFDVAVRFEIAATAK